MISLLYVTVTFKQCIEIMVR